MLFSPKTQLNLGQDTDNDSKTLFAPVYLEIKKGKQYQFGRFFFTKTRIVDRFIDG